MFRAVPFLLAPLLLAGCVQPGSQGLRTGAQAGPAARKVAVLLPLTGPNAGLGRDLLQAVQLALGPDGPQPDVRDTGGTPAGASQAAQAAVASGDGVIIGPLTAPETAAVAAVAQGVPVLAFTSDPQQGRPGVWALGITPQQQVARLVQALAGTGHTRIAAVLPDNAFGAALSSGLVQAAAAAKDAPPTLRRYPTGRVPALEGALRDVAEVTRRSAPAADSTDPLMATVPPAQPTGAFNDPPPFDALLLAESGPGLQAASAALSKDGITSPAVQVVGPATWARDASSLVGLSGAWYAAPDPANRGAFEQIYTARYGSPPPAFASIAYDAALLARTAAGDPQGLTRPNGFLGADGPILLRADGSVTRGLAVFAVGPSGGQVIEPAPTSLGRGS